MKLIRDRRPWLLAGLALALLLTGVFPVQSQTLAASGLTGCSASPRQGCHYVSAGGTTDEPAVLTRTGTPTATPTPTTTPTATPTVTPTTGSIAGTAYVDENHNGTIDAGEAPLDGVSVDLTNVAGLLLDSATTADGGLYGFSGVAPGLYFLEIEPLQGYIPAQWRPAVLVSAGQTTTVDLAHYRLPRIYLPAVWHGQETGHSMEFGIPMRHPAGWHGQETGHSVAAWRPAIASRLQSEQATG